MKRTRRISVDSRTAESSGYLSSSNTFTVVPNTGRRNSFSDAESSVTFQSAGNEAEKFAMLAREVLSDEEIIKNAKQMVASKKKNTNKGKKRGRNAEDVPFVGRQAELRILSRAIDSLFPVQESAITPSSIQGKSRVITIRGESGAGKSRLARQLKSEVINRGGYFLCGKYQKNFTQQNSHSSTGATPRYLHSSSSANAMHALASAMQDLVEQILDRDLDMGIRRRLDESLKPGDVLDLLEMFPCLDRILSFCEDEDEDGSTRDHSALSSNNENIIQTDKTQVAIRRQRLFIKLFRAIASNQMYKDEDIVTGEDSEPSESINVSPDPIVLVLDDVQWQDPASCDLMSALVRDCTGGEGVQSFILIATIRETESSQEEAQGAAKNATNTTESDKEACSLFDKEMDAWKLQRISVEEVNMQRLDAVEVDSILNSILERPSVDGNSISGSSASNMHCSTESLPTLPLAEVICEKSAGNAFLAIEFIYALIDKEILYFNYGKRRWKYHLEKVQAMNLSSGKSAIVELLVEKLCHLSPGESFVFLTAACLGGSFRYSLITTVVQEIMNEPDVSPNNLPSIDASETISSLVKQGFLKQQGNHSGILGDTLFYISHDLLREAILNASSLDVINRLRLRLGECILVNIVAQNPISCSSDVLYLGADLCNAAGRGEGRKLSPIDLAKSNLLAGDRAMEETSFALALRFMENGLQLLTNENTGSEKDSEIHHVLLAGLAEANFCAGSLDTMCMYADQCLKMDNCDEKVRLRMLYLKVNAFFASGDEKASIESGWEAIRLLGLDKFPLYPSLFTVGKEILKTKHILRGLSKQDLLDLPRLSPDNEKRLEALRIFDAMSPACYTSNTNFLIVKAFKAVRWAVKYGITRYTPAEFTIYGLVVASILGDVKAGTMYGEVGLALAEKLDIEEATAKSSDRYFALIHHLRNDLRESYAPILYSHKISLECGATQAAFEAATNLLTTAFCTARVPLRQFSKELQHYCYLSRHYKFWANFSIFDGIATITSQMSGESEYFKWIQDDPSPNERTVAAETTDEHPVVKKYIAVAALQANFFLGTDQVMVQVEILDDVVKKLIGQPSLPQTLMYRGLAFLSLALEGVQIGTNKRKAKAELKMLTMWRDNGNVNCQHMVCILEAELARLKKDEKAAPKLYSDAIMHANFLGRLQDAGACNERAAAYFLSIGDEREAMKHVRQSIKCFLDWGALAVVEKLSEKYPNMAPTWAASTRCFTLQDSCSVPFSVNS